MNAMHLLADEPDVERLGSTLLHFLWEGVLIAALYAAARRAARASGPNVRYILACAAVAAMAAAPVLTWSLLRPEAPNAVATSFTAPLSAATSTTVRGNPVSALIGGYRAVPAPFLPWVVAVWLAGATALWLRLLGGWALAARLRSTCSRPAPPKWQQTFNRLRIRIRVSGPVRLRLSPMVDTPGAMGWLRPVVLMPAGAFAGLSTGHVEALLLHEPAHIRRHDYLINILQSVVEALLFYHPAVWWVSGHIRSERELCCDDLAVSVSGDAVAYARALAELGSAAPATFGAVMAANGGSLANRIARLIGQPRPAARTLSGSGIVVSALLLVFAAIAVLGQPAAGSKFQVASVKPSTQPGFQVVRPLPGRLTANATVQLLIQNAYSVQSFQVVGAPEWAASERWQIEAKADGSASRAQVFQMLQTLLEDRCQLKIHRETKELPVYALEPAKGGIKAPPPAEGSCVEPSVDAPSEWAGGRVAPPGNGQSSPTPCGSLRVALQSSFGDARVQGGKVRMPELVRVLSMMLDRPVTDRTGFTGLFDVRLDFQVDETTAALPPPPPGAGPAPDSSSPSILTALPEQLGLRLTPAKGPVEVIVIDHIERPSAN
jgi:uncharacterized protein (TIGR03435 family)